MLDTISIILSLVTIVLDIIPVSYTHLDVYKRQCQRFPKHFLSLAQHFPRAPAVLLFPSQPRQMAERGVLAALNHGQFISTTLLTLSFVPITIRTSSGPMI